MSDTPHPEHTHNWTGTRNHCTLCDKWCVDTETERRIRADERRRVLGEARGCVSVHFNNGVCPPNGQICINSILKEIDQLSKMKETPE